MHMTESYQALHILPATENSAMLGMRLAVGNASSQKSKLLTHSHPGLGTRLYVVAM